MNGNKKQSTGSLLRVLVAERTPSQLALAVALGVAIGLVPKLNLIAAAWLLLLFVCRVNLFVGLLVATCVSFVGLMIDPYLHRFGDSLLQAELLRPAFRSIYCLPMGPWTCINNTVVAAATAVGLLQLLPTYCLARTFLARRFDQLDNHWVVKAARSGTSTGWRI